MKGGMLAINLLRRIAREHSKLIFEESSFYHCDGSELWFLSISRNCIETEEDMLEFA